MLLDPGGRRHEGEGRGDGNRARRPRRGAGRGLSPPPPPPPPPLGPRGGGDGNRPRRRRRGAGRALPPRLPPPPLHVGRGGGGLGPDAPCRALRCPRLRRDAPGRRAAPHGADRRPSPPPLPSPRRPPPPLAGPALQDTRAGADTEEAKANRAALAARVLTEGAVAAAEAFLPKLVGETTRRERPELVARIREWILATSPRGIANALHGLAARVDSRDTLATVDVPTLVLVGEEDTLTPKAEAEALAAGIRGSRLEVIPRAGHLANLENPNAVHQALRRFLVELP